MALNISTAAQEKSNKQGLTCGTRAKPYSASLYIKNVAAAEFLPTSHRLAHGVRLLSALALRELLVDLHDLLEEAGVGRGVRSFLQLHSAQLQLGLITQVTAASYWEISRDTAAPLFCRSELQVRFPSISTF